MFVNDCLKGESLSRSRQKVPWVVQIVWTGTRVLDREWFLDQLGSKLPGGAMVFGVRNVEQDSGDVQISGVIALLTYVRGADDGRYWKLNSEECSVQVIKCFPFGVDRDGVEAFEKMQNDVELAADSEVDGAELFGQRISL
jgi:hypothetical protein